MSPAKLRELLAAATGGAWVAYWNGVVGCGSEHCVQTKHGAFSPCGGTAERRKANAALIAAAVSELPRLLDVVDVLRERGCEDIEKQEAACPETDDDRSMWCPTCTALEAAK